MRMKAKEPASVFGRYSDKPEVLVSRRIVALVPSA